MRVLRSVSVIEFHLDLADMPELAMFQSERLRNYDTTQQEVAPVQATIRIVGDAFEEVRFFRHDLDLFRAFRAGDEMPPWVHEFLNSVLPDDMGYAFHITGDGQGV